MNPGVREGEAAERAQPAEGLYVRAVAEPLLSVTASVSGGAEPSAAPRLRQHRPHLQPAVAFFRRGLVRSGGAGGQAAWGGGVRSGPGEAGVSAGAWIHRGSM